MNNICIKHTVQAAPAWEFVKLLMISYSITADTTHHFNQCQEKSPRGRQNRDGGGRGGIGNVVRAVAVTIKASRGLDSVHVDVDVLFNSDDMIAMTFDRDGKHASCFVGVDNHKKKHR